MDVFVSLWSVAILLVGNAIEKAKWNPLVATYFIMASLLLLFRKSLSIMLENNFIGLKSCRYYLQEPFKTSIHEFIKMCTPTTWVMQLEALPFRVTRSFNSLTVAWCSKSRHLNTYLPYAEWHSTTYPFMLHIVLQLDMVVLW